MDIKKIVYAILLTVLCCWCQSQVTENSVTRANEKYSKFYFSQLASISPDNRWGVITDTNLYGMERTKILDIKNSKTEEVPFSSRYFFFDNNIVIAQGTGQTVMKNVLKKSEKVITGNFQYLPFAKEGKMVFYERKTRQLLFFDTNFNEVLHVGDVGMISFHEGLPLLDFTMGTKVNRINVRSMKKYHWESSDTVRWIGGSAAEVITVASISGGYKVGQYDTNNRVDFKKLEIPSGFYLDSLSWSLVELKNNRYLVLPLKKESAKKHEKGEIFYTNQNNNYREPSFQMALFDMKNNIWKRLPDRSDEYVSQQFIDQKGTILSYDPSKDTVENLINARYEQWVEDDFGGVKRKIDNSYALRENFYFDADSKRMMYYKDRRWRIENIYTHKSYEIPFEKPEHFMSEVFSGLSDRPSGRVYATNMQSKYIITDAYDLFLVDVVNVTVKRLTFGREKELMYSIAEPMSKPRQTNSYWDKEILIPINLSKKILLKAFSQKDFGSKLCDYDYKRSELKVRVQTDDMIQDIYKSGHTIVYTMESYQKPLSVHILREGNRKLVYQSKGVDEGELVTLKKEIIRYEVKGRTYHASLLYPANFRADAKYPLIFNIYERKAKDVLNYLIPHLYDMQGFNIMHYVYSGYFVLLPDFDYEVENVGSSISNSVDAIVNVLKNNKSVDLNTIGVSGHSFGGYETAFLMTQNKWFATGIAGAGFVDMARQAMSYHKFSYLNYVPDYARIESQQNRMIKSLFENYQGYLDNSPIYHLKKMSKPILLWAGKDDDNINTDQSRSFFIGMKRLSKKGVLLEYPKEKHNLRIGDNQLDLNVKSWQWMDFYLKGSKPADWIKPMLE